MGKTFNTGYLQNIIQYDGSNNIILPSLIGTGTRIVVAAANGTLSSQTASTTNIAEGTNLYYTDTRVGTYLSANTYATQSYVTTAIANLVDASPATLDTLNELAAALGDDPNFATTVATSIGTKQAQLNGTGFVKVSGTTVSYDNSTYLTTSSASSTYVPYTGASADLVLGANNFSSKRVSVLKSSDGYGGFTSNYLFLQTGSSTTNVGTDGISLLSKPNTRALVINYDIGGTNYGATLDAALLTGGRTFEFPNASGVLALTSNIPTNNNQLTNGAGYITSSALSPYLLLAGGIMSGNISYGVGNGVAWYLQPQAVGGGPTNGAVLRLKSHAGAGALTDRSGALAWIDGNNSRLDLFEWNSSLINAYVPINGTSAVFSSTVTTTGLTTGTTGGSTISITTSNNAGITGTPLQTKLNFLGYNGNINGQIRVDDISSTAQVGSMQFYTWNSAQVLALTLAHTGAATFSSTVRTGGVSIGVAATANVLDVRGENNTFDGTIVIGARGTLQHRDAGQTITSLANDYNDNAAKMEFRMKGNTSANSVLTLLGSGAATFSSTVTTVGLLTGQASIYQADAGGMVASNRWSVYNGGATSMRFLYNASGDVIWDNGNPKMTLTSGGNLLVGTTTDSGYKIDVQQGASNAAKFNFVVTGAWGGGANQDHGMLISGARHTSDTNTSLLHILNLDGTSLFKVTDYGKVGVNTFTPTAALDINGDVRYRGSIYDSFNFVASGNYTNGTYYNIVGVNIIPTGIYIIEGLVDTFAAGGGIYFMRFASVPFFMWDVGSNSTTFVDLPPVLGTGHHLGNQFPSFRLQQTLAGAGIHLQFTPNSTWAGIDNSSGKSFRVNLKRIG
jgi:hypothetical protein